MNLLNIHNQKRLVYLFTRDKNDELSIIKDNTFYPYYYEIVDLNRYNSAVEYTYDNLPVKKIICSEPRDVGQQRTVNSYEADILFTKRYIIDKVDKFDKTLIKYLFLDIEVLSKEMPDPYEAKDTISCITIYNSLYKNIQTWFLPDFKSEQEMLDDFVEYIKNEEIDVIFAWNMEFDYVYLFKRIQNFAKRISPIAQARYSDLQDILYPAGISIMDYMSMFKKIYMQEQSYALDKIAQKYLNEQEWKVTTFGVLDNTVKEKNINDINRLIKLEQKFNIINYYDEIRRFATCLWEDLISNSRVLDMIVLREAKKRKLILPNKQKRTGEDELQGAYRRAEVGVFYDIYKADVASMYPNQLINFCLDIQNIRLNPDEDTINIDGVHIAQHPTALLPSISKDLIQRKNAIKTELKAIKDHNSEQYIITQNKYNACKALVNSLYGVMAFPSFRLYSNVLASKITFLARELLMFAEEKMKEIGYEVIYTDTDALMYKADKDETDLLNQLVTKWAKEKYNKDDIDITFESEGKFDKILILGKCHYYGIKGNKKEIKGMEIKRSSSSKYEAWFQETLIQKILNKEDKDNIIQWIKIEKENLSSRPIFETAFPCKIATREYKNNPIFIRAYNNSQKLFKNFKINKGELYHYIFVIPTMKDERNKPVNVIAIKENINLDQIKIDWKEMTRRNIMMKANALFEALGWEMLTTDDDRQLQFDLFGKEERTCKKII